MSKIPVLSLLLALMFSLPAFAQQGGSSQVSRIGAIDRGGLNPALAPFYHGVASGDPTQNSVVIWTRITPDAGQTSIMGSYYVALDTGFTQPVSSGSFTTDADKDYTVKVELGNLTPGTTYYYFFRALNANSLIGRAKTCPNTTVANLKFAVVSCSNYEGGYFNAYQEIAKRNDLDAVIHLGDYIYEYGAGVYGGLLPDRVNEPATEIITLADYRTRYSLYRLDEDLIRLHQQHTMISVWDDHESANDSYTDGAENHQANEGSWETRKGISKQVYFEWMPVRNFGGNQTVYRQLSYGGLCDLFMLDTRLEGRVQPPPHFDTPDNPVRNIISPTQMNWLLQGLKQSSARWKVLGNQVLFSTFNVGFAGGAFDGVPDPVNIDSIRASEDLFIDNWESYPTQRNAVIDTLRNQNIDNVIIVTGDSHSSWAFDVTKQAVQYPVPAFFYLPQPNPYNSATQEGYNAASGEGSWAVEFGTPSISSPNFDEAVGAATTAQFEQFMNNPIALLGGVNYNPHLKYVDLDRNGYILLDLTEGSAQANFYYVPTVYADTTGESFERAALTLNGQNRLQLSTTPSAPKPVQDVPTPLLPPAISSGTASAPAAANILSCYPNPATDQLYVQMAINEASDIAVNIYDAAGSLVQLAVSSKRYEAGVYNLVLPVQTLSAGAYLLSIESRSASPVTYKFVKR